jgi:hypothetical protein
MLPPLGESFERERTARNINSVTDSSCKGKQIGMAESQFYSSKASHGYSNNRATRSTPICRKLAFDIRDEIASDVVFVTIPGAGCGIHIVRGVCPRASRESGLSWRSGKRPNSLTSRGSRLRRRVADIRPAVTSLPESRWATTPGIACHDPRLRCGMSRRVKPLAG